MSINKKSLEQAKEWLRKWDANELVWSVEMGGLGPGYEQAIQITMAEILRWFIKNESDPSDWVTLWKQESEKLRKDILGNNTVENLGLSGAQYGAAVSLASVLYKRGTDALNDEEVNDRKIQVQKIFPQNTDGETPAK